VAEAEFQPLLMARLRFAEAVPLQDRFSLPGLQLSESPATVTLFRQTICLEIFS